MEFIGPILPLFPVIGHNASEGLGAFLPSNEERLGIRNAREALDRLRLSNIIELDYLKDNNPEIAKFIFLVSENIFLAMGPSNTAAARSGMLAFHRASTLQQVSSTEKIPLVSPESLNAYFKEKNATVVNNELVVFEDFPVEELVIGFLETEGLVKASLDEFELKDEHQAGVVLGMALMKDFLQFDHSSFES